MSVLLSLTSLTQLATVGAPVFGLCAHSNRKFQAWLSSFQQQIAITVSVQRTPLCRLTLVSLLMETQLSRQTVAIIQQHVTSPGSTVASIACMQKCLECTCIAGPQMRQTGKPTLSWSAETQQSCLQPHRQPCNCTALFLLLCL